MNKVTYIDRRKPDNKMSPKCKCLNLKTRINLFYTNYEENIVGRA